MITHLPELKNSSNISIELSDKTNKFCIMDRSYMENKMNELKGESFKLLRGDPSKSIEKKANKLLDKIWDESNEEIMSPSLYKHLYAAHSSSPHMFCFIKDHKDSFPNNKARPVQPGRWSAVEKFDILVSAVLTQLGTHLKYRVFNSAQFQNKIKNVGLPENKFMFSLDVVSMYPSLPTDDKAIEIIESYLNNHKDNIDMFGVQPSHIIQFLKFVLENNYIMIGDEYFTQESGISTGGRLSQAYADIIIDYMYFTAITNSTITPENLSLYVDDSWGIWPGDWESFLEFIKVLESMWDKVKFTYSKEENGRLVFLDMVIKRHKGNMATEFSQKDTHSGTYLHYSSHCPIIIKINLIKNEARRILQNCTFMVDSYKYLNNLRLHLLNSGYPLEFINSNISKIINEHCKPPRQKKDKEKFDYIIKVPFISEQFTRVVKSNIKKSGFKARVVVESGISLKDLTRNKINKPCSCLSCNVGVPCGLRNFVYKANCQKCNEEYIGCSYRPAKARIGEHESSVRNNNKRTTLGQHMVEHGQDEESDSGATSSNENGGRPIRDKNERDRVNALELNKSYKFSIVRKCKDSLESFISEGLYIKEEKPKINNCIGNGYIH